MYFYKTKQQNSTNIKKQATEKTKNDHNLNPKQKI